MSFTLRLNNFKNAGIDGKNVKELNTRYYRRLLTQKIMDAFEWEGLPETIDKRYMELTLLYNGIVGIGQPYEGSTDLYALRGGLVGDINEYDLPTEYQYVSVKYSGTKKVGEDCVVGYNNNLIYPTFPMIDKYAALLAESDASLGIAIINSRLTNLFEVSDDIELRQVEDAIQKIKDGDVGVVKSRRFYNNGADALIPKEIRNQNSTGSLMDIVNVRESILGMFAVEIGLAFTDKLKKAQVNSAELEGMSQYSQTCIDDMLKQRQKLADDCNNLFGTNITVRINPIYKIEEGEPEDTDPEDTDPEDTDPEEVEGGCVK